MPWDKLTLYAVTEGLRSGAAEGSFVPFQWNAGIEHSKDGGYTIYGCGWGQIAWIVAVYQGGAEYARRMLPVGAGQTEVNIILKAAGLTRAEIKQLDPQALWTRFDYELEEAYRSRKEDYQYYIEMSQWLAEFFIDELESVPVVSDATTPEPAASISVATKLKDLWPAFFGKLAQPELV